MSWTGFRIWIFSVLLNGVFLGVWVAFEESPVAFLPIAFGAGLIGLFVTAPLLVIVLLVVDLAGKIPYSVNARIFWVFIILAIIGCSYIFLLQLMITKTENELANGLKILVSLAIGLAVFFERNSLRRRYEIRTDEMEENQEAMNQGQISNM